jgi:hypothetical protein
MMGNLTRKKFMADVAKLEGYSEWKGRWDLKGSGEIRFYFPHKDRTCYLEFYRTSWGLEKWASHLEGFYKTGKMSTFAWWETYTSSRIDGEYKKIGGNDAHRVKMKIDKGGKFNIHSPQHNANMIAKRKIQGDIGFTHISKPV